MGSTLGFVDVSLNYSLKLPLCYSTNACLLGDRAGMSPTASRR